MTDVTTLTVDIGRQKRDLVELAYQICGINIDALSPEDLSDGLRDLNFMMMETPWSELGFTLPTYGDGDLAEASGLLDKYVPAVIHELAMRRAPAKGKSLSVEAAARVRTTRATLETIIAVVPTFKMRGGVSLGSGRRCYGVHPLYSSNETDTETVVADDDPGDLGG
ncbi:MAG: packaged DNA stabilization gp4 family protein [Pseudomonadota bacterium]